MLKGLLSNKLVIFLIILVIGIFILSLFKNELSKSSFGVVAGPTYLGATSYPGATACVYSATSPNKLHIDNCIRADQDVVILSKLTAQFRVLFNYTYFGITCGTACTTNSVYAGKRVEDLDSITFNTLNFNYTTKEINDISLGLTSGAAGSGRTIYNSSVLNLIPLHADKLDTLTIFDISNYLLLAIMFYGNINAQLYKLLNRDIKSGQYVNYNEPEPVGMVEPQLSIFTNLMKIQNVILKIIEYVYLLSHSLIINIFGQVVVKISVISKILDEIPLVMQNDYFSNKFNDVNRSYMSEYFKNVILGTMSKYLTIGDICPITWVAINSCFGVLGCLNARIDSNNNKNMISETAISMPLYTVVGFNNMNTIFAMRTIPGIGIVGKYINDTALLSPKQMSTDVLNNYIQNGTFFMMKLSVSSFLDTITEFYSNFPKLQYIINEKYNQTKETGNKSNFAMIPLQEMYELNNFYFTEADTGSYKVSDIFIKFILDAGKTTAKSLPYSVNSLTSVSLRSKIMEIDNAYMKELGESYIDATLNRAGYYPNFLLDAVDPYKLYTQYSRSEIIELCNVYTDSIDRAIIQHINTLGPVGGDQLIGPDTEYLNALMGARQIRASYFETILRYKEDDTILDLSIDEIIGTPVNVNIIPKDPFTSRLAATIGKGINDATESASQVLGIGKDLINNQVTKMYNKMFLAKKSKLADPDDPTNPLLETVEAESREAGAESFINPLALVPKIAVPPSVVPVAGEEQIVSGFLSPVLGMYTTYASFGINVFIIGIQITYSIIRKKYKYCNSCDNPFHGEDSSGTPYCYKFSCRSLSKATDDATYHVNVNDSNSCMVDCETDYLHRGNTDALCWRNDGNLGYSDCRKRFGVDVLPYGVTGPIDMLGSGHPNPMWVERTPGGGMGGGAVPVVEPNNYAYSDLNATVDGNMTGTTGVTLCRDPNSWNNSTQKWETGYGNILEQWFDIGSRERRDIDVNYIDRKNTGIAIPSKRDHSANMNCTWSTDISTLSNACKGGLSEACPKIFTQPILEVIWVFSRHGHLLNIPFSETDFNIFKNTPSIDLLITNPPINTVINTFCIGDTNTQITYKADGVGGITSISIPNNISCKYLNGSCNRTTLTYDTGGTTYMGYYTVPYYATVPNSPSCGYTAGTAYSLINPGITLTPATINRVILSSANVSPLFNTAADIGAYSLELTNTGLLNINITTTTRGATTGTNTVWSAGNAGTIQLPNNPWQLIFNASKTGVLKPGSLILKKLGDSAYNNIVTIYNPTKTYSTLNNLKIQFNTSTGQIFIGFYGKKTGTSPVGWDYVVIPTTYYSGSKPAYNLRPFTITQLDLPTITSSLQGVTALYDYCDFNTHTKYVAYSQIGGGETLVAQPNAPECGGFPDLVSGGMIVSSDPDSVSGIRTDKLIFTSPVKTRKNTGGWSDTKWLELGNDGVFAGKSYDTVSRAITPLWSFDISGGAGSSESPYSLILTANGDLISKNKVGEEKWRLSTSTNILPGSTYTATLNRYLTSVIKPANSIRVWFDTRYGNFYIRVNSVSLPDVSTIYFNTVYLVNPSLIPDRRTTNPVTKVCNADYTLTETFPDGLGRNYSTTTANAVAECYPFEADGLIKEATISVVDLFVFKSPFDTTTLGAPWSTSKYFTFRNNGLLTGYSSGTQLWQIDCSGNGGAGGGGGPYSMYLGSGNLYVKNNAGVETWRLSNSVTTNNNYRDTLTKYIDGMSITDDNIGVYFDTTNSNLYLKNITTGLIYFISSWYTNPPRAAGSTTTSCSGTTLVTTTYNGFDGFSTSNQVNSSSCGYIRPFNCPPIGTVGSTSCNGTTYIKNIYQGGVSTNGNISGCATTVQSLPNTPPCVPAAGSNSSTVCQGYNLVTTSANGLGGTRIDNTITNVPACGYRIPNPVINTGSYGFGTYINDFISVTGNVVNFFQSPFMSTEVQGNNGWPFVNRINTTNYILVWTNTCQLKCIKRKINLSGVITDDILWIWRPMTVPAGYAFLDYPYTLSASMNNGFIVKDKNNNTISTNYLQTKFVNPQRSSLGLSFDFTNRNLTLKYMGGVSGYTVITALTITYYAGSTNAIEL